MPRKMFVWALFLSFSASLSSQTQKVISIPLADVLPAALAKSSLTSPEAHPFHLKLKVRDVFDAKSPMQAEIEEYWLSPTLWKRIVTAPNLQQVATRNASGLHYETTGDYFPQWLSMFVTAIEDPVRATLWSRPGLHLRQTELRPGILSAACAALNVHLSESAAPLATLCLSSIQKDARLTSIHVPGYQMEFNEFSSFHGQTIPYLYITHLTNTVLIGKINLLELLKEKEEFFATPSSSVDVNPLASIMVSAPVVEKMAKPHAEIPWPPVAKGKTSGNITLFVSVDNQGKTREVSMLDSDNVRLEQTAFEQALKFSWAVPKSNGKPTQITGVYSLPFQTTMKDEPEKTVVETVPAEVTRGRALSQTKPQYPPQARSRHSQGTVYLFAEIAADGSVSRLGLIESPDDSLTRAAMDAVKQWKYEPFLFEGVPTNVLTTITVNFAFQ